MTQTVAFELAIPDELAKFRLPRGVNARLQELLDKQDQGQKLTLAEKQEARGLVKVSELLSLLKMRATRTRSRPNPKSR